jgi:hypothetical protein
LFYTASYSQPLSFLTVYCSTERNDVAQVNVPVSHLVLQQESDLLSSYARSKLYYAQPPPQRSARCLGVHVSHLDFGSYLVILQSLPSRYGPSLTHEINGIRGSIFDSKTPLATRPHSWPKADRSILRHHGGLVSAQFQRTQVEITL